MVPTVQATLWSELYRITDLSLETEIQIVYPIQSCAFHPRLKMSRLIALSNIQSCISHYSYLCYSNEYPDAYNSGWHTGSDNSSDIINPTATSPPQQMSSTREEYQLTANPTHTPWDLPALSNRNIRGGGDTLYGLLTTATTDGHGKGDGASEFLYHSTPYASHLGISARPTTIQIEPQTLTTL